MSMSSHPYYTDPDFVAKLPLYKTAWSLLYKQPVGIHKVRKDEDGVPIIDAHVHGHKEGSLVMFRATELTNFVL